MPNKCSIASSSITVYKKDNVFVHASFCKLMFIHAVYFYGDYNDTVLYCMLLYCGAVKI